MAGVLVMPRVLLVRRLVIIAWPPHVPCMRAEHPVRIMPRAVVCDLTVLCAVLVLLMIHVPSH
jgi:hypothetical protein